MHRPGDDNYQQRPRERARQLKRRQQPRLLESSGTRRDGRQEPRLCGRLLSERGDRLVPFFEPAHVVADFELLAIGRATSPDGVVGVFHGGVQRIPQGLRFGTILAERQLKLERARAQCFDVGLLAGEEPIIYNSRNSRRSHHVGLCIQQ